ncbi:MAG: N-acetyl-gamma-glutamyl-phosphate reductase [Treponema sp.]|jgi:N-acetyl-gamma-glutamyl-phosphate reductase|nr:N-acetyl-gamma-glutamyl-phosphate reductase [Treponema sp.]
MKPKVYIDGKEGTTGLQIYERLGKRQDIELLLIDEADRKDISRRGEFINSADMVFLCLPDDAAREAVRLIGNPAVRVIDASTAHRTAEGWVYGFPELSEAQRESIKQARFVANPGCHASGVIALLFPLITRGLVPADYPFAITSLTGYSGGGKGMITRYEAPERPEEYRAPRLYGLSMAHKHIPEIVAMTGLAAPPAFTPVIGDYYCGMEIIIPLHRRLIRAGKAEVLEALRGHYAGSRFIRVAETPPDSAYLPSNAFAGTDDMELCVSGSEAIMLLIARFDNLGKGASGAAVQNMDLMLGLQ